MVSHIADIIIFNVNVNKKYIKGLIHNVTLLKFIQNLRYNRCSERNTEMNVFENGADPLICKAARGLDFHNFPQKGWFQQFAYKEESF